MEEEIVFMTRGSASPHRVPFRSPEGKTTPHRRGTRLVCLPNGGVNRFSAFRYFTLAIIFFSASADAWSPSTSFSLSSSSTCFSIPNLPTEVGTLRQTSRIP